MEVCWGNERVSSEFFINSGCCLLIVCFSLYVEFRACSDHYEDCLLIDCGRASLGCRSLYNISMKRKKINKFPVRVTFLDHCQADAPDIGLLNCEVFGIIREETDLQLNILSWIGDQELNSKNTDGYALVKHKGFKIEKLLPESMCCKKCKEKLNGYNS